MFNVLLELLSPALLLCAPIHPWRLWPVTALDAQGDAVTTSGKLSVTPFTTDSAGPAAIGAMSRIGHHVSGLIVARAIKGAGH
jgi:hypothetical protein